MSSLRNVQDLELESRKVPQLEARIDDLEKLLPVERYILKTKYIILYCCIINEPKNVRYLLNEKHVSLIT